MARKMLKIACMDIGTADLKWWAPQVIDKYPGGFHEMHEKLFSRAAEGLGTEVSVDKFSPRDNDYPEKVSAYDGVVVTGCANSANDPEPWLDELKDRLRIWSKEGVKLSGFSFGPQILAVALGGAVEKNPKGSELSVVSIELTEAFRKKFKEDNRSSYLIHVHHNDHVSRLPDGAVSIGGTRVTETSGFFLNDNVLCFAGHPEYSMDPWVLDQLMQLEMKENLIATQHILYGQEVNYKRTDWLWQTRLQLRFFNNEFS